MARTPDRTQARTASGSATRRPQKLAEMIALDIVRDMIEQRMVPGDVLPQEAEMVTRYGVSRTSFREALRLLEVQGLIRIRPGTGGGTVVGTSDYISLSRTLRLHLHFVGATYDDLLSTSLRVEPFLAEMAAANPDRETVRALMSPHLDVTSGGDVKTLGSSFHEDIARASGNPVLALTVRSLIALMDDHIVEAVRGAQLRDIDSQVLHEHAVVARAVIAGEPDAARRAMAEHMRHVVDYFQEFLPAAIGTKISLP